jgi:Sensors of blue-light using FAD
MLVRLIYASRAREDVDLAECRRLVSTSQASNALAELTGVLLFNSMTFVQALEGETDKVNALYNRHQIAHLRRCQSAPVFAVVHVARLP